VLLMVVVWCDHLVPCCHAPPRGWLLGVVPRGGCTLVPCSLWYLMPCYPLGVCTPGAAHGGGGVV